MKCYTVRKTLLLRDSNVYIWLPRFDMFCTTKISYLRAVSMLQFTIFEFNCVEMFFLTFTLIQCLNCMNGMFFEGGYRKKYVSLWNRLSSFSSRKRFIKMKFKVCQRLYVRLVFVKYTPINISTRVCFLLYRMLDLQAFYEETFQLVYFILAEVCFF